MPSTKAVSLGRNPVDPDLDTYEGRMGAHLRALRERKHWSVDALIEKLSLVGLDAAKTTIYSWEQGHRLPSMQAVLALSAVYGKNPRLILPEA